ncbi:unnamed protein product [Malus baccata var. baccata]
MLSTATQTSPKLNVDGCRKDPLTFIRAGGVLRNSLELGILGHLFGIKTCLNKGFQCLLLEFDSAISVHLISHRATNNHSNGEFIQACRAILLCDWKCNI